MMNIKQKTIKKFNDICDFAADKLNNMTKEEAETYIHFGGVVVSFCVGHVVGNIVSYHSKDEKKLIASAITTVGSFAISSILGGAAEKKFFEDGQEILNDLVDKNIIVFKEENNE